MDDGNAAPAQSAAIFHERQQYGPWWLWLLVVAGAVGAWAMLLVVVLGDVRTATGLAVILLLVVGIGLPALFLSVYLDVTVRVDRVDIRFFPFLRRTIALREVARAEARRYHPIREYGGWGIKGWSTRKVAYNVKGDRGVDLTLHDGRRVLLGSQRVEELAEAIRGNLGATGDQASS